MSDVKSYGQFCPVSMAAEVLCARWTPLIVRELLCGSTRFNDLRRGVPRMSPTLLSKRLKEMAAAGIVRIAPGERGAPEYRLTEAGRSCARSSWRWAAGASAGSSPRCLCVTSTPRS